MRLFDFFKKKNNKIKVTIESLRFNYPISENPNIPIDLYKILLWEGSAEIDIETYNEIKDKTEEGVNKELLLNKTAELNNIGIKLEKEGNIEKAIEVYLENIELGYPATHSYDRLIILYNKAKDYNKALYITKKAIKKFPKHIKYKERKEKIELKINKK